VKQVIREWVKSKLPVIMLGNRSIETPALSYAYYNFMGRDDKFYSCNFVYDRTRIIGSISQLETLRISGEVLDADIPEERSIFEVLDQYLEVYNTKEEWVKNRPPMVTKENFEKYINSYISSSLEKVTGFVHGDFRVEETYAQNDLSVLIYYSLDGILYSPLKYLIAEPSPLRIRNHKEKSKEFREFAEKIGDFFSGVIWY
jgi:hypothetical protein